MSLPPGRPLGPCEILSVLGAGGMGKVHRARDTTPGREIAPMVLPEIVFRDPERLSRFGREARLLASPSHPGTTVIHGLEEVEGIRFPVLEREPDGQALVPGTPARIRDLLRRCLSKDVRRRLRHASLIPRNRCVAGGPAPRLELSPTGGRVLRRDVEVRSFLRPTTGSIHTKGDSA